MGETVTLTEQQERINTCLVDTLGLEPSDVTGEANLRNDLGIDSLSAVEVAMALEDEFEIEVANDEIEKLTTVQDIYTLIEGKAASD